MTDEYTPARAHADLDRADASATRMRARAEWMSVYLAVFGIGFGAMTVIAGLTGPAALLFTLPAWLVLVTVMAVWAHRQRARLRGAARRMVPPWIATSALYTAALWTLPKGRPVFWITAGLVVAAPLLVAAIRERRL